MAVTTNATHAIHHSRTHRLRIETVLEHVREIVLTAGRCRLNHALLMLLMMMVSGGGGSYRMVWMKVMLLLLLQTVGSGRI